MRRLVIPGACLAALLHVTAACGSPEVATRERPLAHGRSLELGSEIALLAGDEAAEGWFGDVTSVASDGANRVYVLDGRLQRLHAFDSTGARLWGTGRGGRAPGEFLVPQVVAATLSGEIKVFDPAQKTVQEFVNAKVVNVFKFEEAAGSFCSWDNGFVVAGLNPTGLLHAYDEAGMVAAHFGEGFHRTSNDSPLLRRLLSEALILCAKDRRVLVVARNLPQVRAVGTDGREMWRTVLPGIVPLELSMQGAGVIHRSVAQGFDRPVSLWQVDDTTAVLQYARVGDALGSDETHPEYSTHLLDLRDGREVGAQKDLPLILHAAGGRAYVARRDPVPAVAIISFTERGTRK